MYCTAWCEETGTQAEGAWDVGDGDLSTPGRVEQELVISDLGEPSLLPTVGAATCYRVAFSIVLGTGGASLVGFLATGTTWT